MTPSRKKIPFLRWSFWRLAFGAKQKRSDAHLLASEPCDIHFFQASISMGAWSANTDLVETDASVAKQKINELQKQAQAAKQTGQCAGQTARCPFFARRKHIFPMPL